MSRKTKLQSIFSLSCPRCREGHLFEQPYSFRNSYSMPQRCPVCHQRYEPEPGFYYGAMFISYILTAWIFILVGLGLVFGLGWGVTPTLITVALLGIFIHNLTYRISRSIWIHFFVKYDPSAEGQNNPDTQVRLNR